MAERNKSFTQVTMASDKKNIVSTILNSKTAESNQIDSKSILSPPDVQLTSHEEPTRKNSFLLDQNSFDRSNNSSGLLNAPHHQLSNQFNEKSVMGMIEKSLGSAYQTNVGNMFKHQSSKFTQDFQFLQRQLPIEQGSLNQHLDVELVKSNKCRMCICYKMRDKRFMVKKIPKFVTHELLQPWLDLPPQLPYQNFVNCYGIIEANGEKYTLCDLIEEDVVLASNKNQFEYAKQITLRARGNTTLESLPSCEITDVAYTSPNLSDNENELNFSKLVRSAFKNEDQVSLQQLKQEQRNYNSTGQSPEGLIQNQKDEQTYFGTRKAKTSLRIAKNVYETIHWMNLGNLSGLPKIPEFYMRFLLGYIIQISRAFGHCHKHDLVHGSFNLSKILVQKTQLDFFKYSKIMQKKKNKGIYNKRQTLLLDQKYDSYSFHISNFEPFIVRKTLDKYKNKQQDSYYNIDKIEGMQIDEEDILKITKVQDIQAFANSIVEIMVGKVEEQEKTKMIKDKNFESCKSTIIGGISLDHIPLNWIKMPETQDIFKILGICYGKSQAKEQLKMKTHEIFEEIHSLASSVYKLSYGFEDGLDGNYVFNADQQSLDHQNRLKSVVYNNQAVALYLNITDDTCVDTQERIKLKMKTLLSKALHLSPKNQAAILNKALLEWGQGLMRDRTFLELVQNDLFKIDKYLSILVFILFKKNVYGGQIMEKEIDELNFLNGKQSKMISNISRVFLSHPLFLEFKKNREAKKLLKEHQKYIQNKLKENVAMTHNHRIEMKMDFQTKSVSFSNNEKFSVILGAKRIIIIDCKSAHKMFEFDIPIYQPRTIAQAQQDKKRANFAWKAIVSKGSIIIDENKSVSFQGQQSESVSDKGSEDEEYMDKYIDDDKSEKEQNTKQTLISIREETEITKTNNDSILTSTLNTRQSREFKKKISLRESTEIRLEEEYYHKLYNADWQTNIGNQGRILALFDKAQQIRNKYYKYEKNRKEKMLIYTIVFSKLQNNAPACHTLDMRRLLDDQEVLSFGINDHGASGDFSTICVQAKDLYIYLIDFSSEILLKKIDTKRSNILMKSIFYDHFKEENQQYYQSFNEFVQNQEQIGNQVRIPKLNEDVIAIMEKDSQLVRIYDVKKHIYVRQLFIEYEDIVFKQEVRLEPETKLEQSYQSDDSEQDSEDVLGKVIAEYDQKKRKSFATKVAQRQAKIDNMSATQNEEVSFFDISPNASILVAVFGTEIVFRQLNHSERKQSQNTVQYHASLSFLPLNLDEDYNYFENQKKFIKFKQENITKQEIEDNIENVDYQKIDKKQIDRSIYLFNNLTRKGSSTLMHVKNGWIIELGTLLQYFIQNLKSLFYVKFHSSIKYQKIITIIKMIREYYLLDQIGIKTQGLQSLKPLCILSQLQLERSSDYIIDFTCSSKAKSMNAYVIINRSLHCYSIIDKLLLFKINLPSALLMNDHKRIIITESDKLIIVKTGNSQIQIINIPNVIDIAQKTQYSTKNDQTDLQLVGHLSPESVIKMDFGKEQFEDNEEQQAARKRNDSGSATEDDEEISAFNFYDFDQDIEGIYCSRNKTEFSYLGLIFDFRFCVYFIYEDDSKGSELDKFIDIEYKFNKDINIFGKINCMDFEDHGTHLITGTNLGWILIWNINEKNIVKQIQIFDPIINKPMNISQIREIIDEKTIIAHSKQTNTLVATEVCITSFLLTPHLNSEQGGSQSYGFSVPLTPDTNSRKDIMSLGTRENMFITFEKNIQSIYVDQTQKFFILTFDDGQIQVYDVQKAQFLEKFTVQHSQAIQQSGVFIDDYCTYVAYMGGERKNQIYFELMDWKFTCKKLNKPKSKPSIQIEDQNVTENKQRPASPISPDIPKEKKITCEIF